MNPTSEETERTHLAAFGPSLGPLYHALYSEVIWLHVKWQQYRRLYAKSKNRIALLNKTAGFFFGMVEDALWNDVLLHITRMTDTRKGTLTLDRLPKAIKDTKLATKVRKLVHVARARSEFAREWRNRHIAHRNLELALHAKVQPLPDASRQDVEQALASIREVLNLLHRERVGDDVAFEHVLTYDDADALVHHLSVASQTAERKIERVKSGQWKPEDFELPPKV